MTQALRRRHNHAVYRKLKAALGRDYPPGRFIAVHDGRVVADAAGFDELLSALRAAEVAANECLVVQAGIDLPEKATIFI